MSRQTIARDNPNRVGKRFIYIENFAQSVHNRPCGPPCWLTRAPPERPHARAGCTESRAGVGGEGPFLCIRWVHARSKPQPKLARQNLLAEYLPSTLALPQPHCALFTRPSTILPLLVLSLVTRTLSIGRARASRTRIRCAAVVLWVPLAQAPSVPVERSTPWGLGELDAKRKD